jgi:flavin-dependent dehydrogenase
MKQIEQVDVLIVGSGPAGISTALHMVQADPAWARRIVVVDKAIHPREKLCGGGITSLGEDALAKLGLSIKPPNFSVREARIVYQNYAYAVQGDPVFRVVRRDEFDHWLVQEAEKRGLTVRQGEAVKDITPYHDYVEVVTERTTFQAQVVVAADGSRSFIRQRLKWDDNGRVTGRRVTRKRVARLLEILTPEVAGRQVEFRDGVAVFDFSPMADGLQGYVWDFPSLLKGQPFMNRGIFDSRSRPERPRVALKDIFRAALAKRGRQLDDYQLKGHPIFWFDKKAQFARPRLILAGDAAGVDPLLGEGISFALGYGQVAAAALVDAFRDQDFSFATYRERILGHRLLAQLRLRATVARLAYLLKRPRLISLGWTLFRLFVWGLAWYDRDYVPVKSLRLIKIS